MELDPGPALATAHYAAGAEESRLTGGPGLLERARTQELLERFLPAAPARVADIGSGPGVYSLWLAGRGYAIVARDLVPLHVDQLRAAAAGRGLSVAAAVGDARALDLLDSEFAAALLFGPLYHLQDRAGRLQALREAARVVVPGGVVLAVAISRWALVMDGMLRLRLGEGDPRFAGLVDRAVETGRMDPSQPGNFSGYAHRPAELRTEVAEAGLRETALVSIEGPGAYLSTADLEERWADLSARELVLDVARRLEAVPELAGMGSHLLIAARRPE